MQAAADELGFAVVDKSLIAEVARRASVDEAAVREIDEEEEVGVLGFLSRWSEAGGLPPGMFVESAGYAWDMALQDGAIDDRHQVLDRFEYHHQVEEIVRRVHARGNVIMVGRGGALILKDYPDVFRVRVTASVESRAERLTELRKLSYRAAAKEVQASDRRRAAFVQRWYHVDSADPALYHTVINADATGVELGAALIAAGARALQATANAEGAPGVAPPRGANSRVR